MDFITMASIIMFGGGAIFQTYVAFKSYKEGNKNEAIRMAIGAIILLAMAAYAPTAAENFEASSAEDAVWWYLIFK